MERDVMDKGLLIGYDDFSLEAWGLGIIKLRSIVLF